MNKALPLLALLCGAAGAAHAQSNVSIYGSVDLGLVKKTDTALALSKRDANTLGFKGTEDLGGGLAALFQLEIRYEPDTGTVESNVRPLFQGQSRVGLQGSFGTIRLGRGVSALMAAVPAVDPFHGLPSAVGFYADLAVAGYTGQPLDAAGNSFNRFSNAVFYDSPVLGGFQFSSTIGAKEANGNAAIAGRGTTAAPQYPANANPSVSPYSVSAVYRQGDATALVAYERNGIESSLWTIGAAGKVAGDVRLMASMARQDRSHTAAVNAGTRSWVLGVTAPVGNGTVLFGVGSKKPDGAVQTKQASLGYEYALSKLTFLYADASRKAAATTVHYVDLGIRKSF